MVLKRVQWQLVCGLLLMPFLVMGENTRPGDRDSRADSGEWLVLASPFVWAPSSNGQVSLAGIDTKADVGFREVPPVSG